MGDHRIKRMKKRMRKEALAARDMLEAEERAAASVGVEENLFSFKPFRAARLVMFFVSFRSEVDTKGMIRRALAEGKRVAAPVTNTDDGTLSPFEIGDFDTDLVEGAYGILEPRQARDRLVPPEEIDLLLFPGAAFDHSGGRVGYGGGFYDRFVSRLRQDVPLVAVAFSSQLRESVPMDTHDRPVDYIVTDREIIDCRGARP